VISLSVKTKLGFIDVDKEEIINFKNGIPGFEHLKKFSLISRPDTEPVKWLVSLEDEDVALPVVDPWIIVENYSLTLSEEALAELDYPKENRVLVLAVVDLHSENVTVNLLAPVIINLDKAIGAQLILDDARYTTRYPIKARV